MVNSKEIRKTFQKGKEKKKLNKAGKAFQIDGKSWKG